MEEGGERREGREEERDGRQRGGSEEVRKWKDRRAWGRMRERRGA